MVNLNLAVFDNFIGNVMTALALGLNDVFFGFFVVQEMTCKTSLRIHFEMIFAADMAVARPAGNCDAVNRFANMPVMCEFYNSELYLFTFKFFGIMTGRPQARNILDCSFRFGSDPADHAIDCLGQTGDLALHIAAKARLQMAAKTANLVMTGMFPAGVIAVHDVAAIAKARLRRNRHCHRGDKTHHRDQHDQHFQNAKPAQYSSNR
jgi:hypothetical protein